MLAQEVTKGQALDSASTTLWAGGDGTPVPYSLVHSRVVAELLKLKFSVFNFVNLTTLVS